MRIYRSNSSSFWYYEFVLNGRRYHKSTKMTNEREALKIANAAFTALVKGEAGIGEPKSVPTLKAFREDLRPFERKTQTNRKLCSSTPIRSIRC